MEQVLQNEVTNDGVASVQNTILGAELKKGDREVFADFVRSCQRQIYALIWRMLRNHEDTNDILQDTFLRFYQNTDKLQDDKPVYPYLRRIALNLSINKLKSTKRMLSLDHAFQIADQQKTDGEAEHNELLQTAEKAIRKLPKEQQMVLLLRVQENLSYQEIAHILHVRIGTVMSRLSRAREKMLIAIRKHLKAQEKR